MRDICTWSQAETFSTFIITEYRVHTKVIIAPWTLSGKSLTLVSFTSKLAKFEVFWRPTFSHKTSPSKTIYSIHINVKYTLVQRTFHHFFWNSSKAVNQPHSKDLTVEKSLLTQGASLQTLSYCTSIALLLLSNKTSCETTFVATKHGSKRKLMTSMIAAASFL